jgi:O-antigen/teichoic acid export membrane protein
MVWLAVCVAVPVWLIAGWIMATLYGESFRAAGTVLSVHVWGGVFVSLGVASGRWMVLEGMSRFYLGRTALGVGVIVTGNLVLIPRYGIVGAAVSAVLAQAAVVMMFDALWVATRASFLMKCRALFPLHWLLRA